MFHQLSRVMISESTFQFVLLISCIIKHSAESSNIMMLLNVCKLTLYANSCLSLSELEKIQLKLKQKKKKMQFHVSTVPGAGSFLCANVYTLFSVVIK